MEPFSVAVAAPADCRECAQLLADQLREHGIGSSTEHLVRILQDVAGADTGRGFLMLARADSGRVVGVAYVATILSAEHCGPVAWLEELYVTPDYRHRGIGAALVTSVLERAQKTGIVAVDLEVDADHTQAISLYQRFGFHRLERSRWVKEFTK
jgi:ribosomal protein S18 acetylase RimI-like enzyme